MTDEQKRRTTGHLDRLKARLRPLAPPEMQARFTKAAEATGERGVLRSQPERHRLAIEMQEELDEAWWVPGKVFVVVMILSLAFISWIAWLIANK